jgi:hypothetical protein
MMSYPAFFRAVVGGVIGYLLCSLGKVLLQRILRRHGLLHARPVGPDAPDDPRDIADAIYDVGKHLYASEQLPGVEQRLCGARLKYLVGHLHGRLARN